MDEQDTQKTGHSGVPSQIGAELRRARERQGIEPEKVAHHLHVDVRHIEAIEADRFEELSGPVFVKGYLRNYARMLGLDPAPLIGAYERRMGIEATPPPLSKLKTVDSAPAYFHVVPWRKIQSFLVPIAGLALVAWLTSWVYQFIKSVRQHRETPDVVALPQAPQSAAVPGPGGAGTFALPLPPPSSTVPSSGAGQLAIPPASSTTQSPAASEPELPPDTDMAGASAPPPPAKSKITLKFRADSWAQVTDAQDQRLFARTGKAGENKTLEGIAPFRVVLGHAEGVDIEYNGQPMDFRGRSRGNVARFKVGNGSPEPE